MNCDDKEWQHCRVEKMGCNGCAYNGIKEKVVIELEKVKEWLKNNIKYYEEQIEYINTIDSDYYDEEKDLYIKRMEIFKIILQELNNSIPKGKVEQYLKEEQEKFNVYKKESKENENLKLGMWKHLGAKNMCEKILGIEKNIRKTIIILIKSMGLGKKTY